MDGNAYIPSLADISAVTGSKNGMFGDCGGGMWIFALLVLMFMGRGGGLFGNGGSDRQATVGDIQRSTDFAALERQNNEIVDAVRQGSYDTTGAVKDANYNVLGEIRDLEAATNCGFAGMQKCCCDTNRNIDAARYDMANFANATQTAVHEEGEKTRAMMQQNKIDALQARVNELYTSQQLCGIPKVNMSAWGTYPYAMPSGCNGGYYA